MKHNNHLKIVGLDPSMRNWGVAICYLSQNKMLSVEELTTIKTKPSKRKTQKYLDDIDASKTLCNALIPLLKDADLVVAESPVGSQSAAAMKGYGVCMALLGLIASEHRLFIVSPHDIKKLLPYVEHPSKQDIIKLIDRYHPNTLTKNKQGILQASNEHAADAVASIYAAAKDDSFKHLVNTLLYEKENE